MTLTYRSVKGSNLTAAEFDGNTHNLDDRVSELEDNPVAGASVSNIVQSGNQVTYFLSDGTTFGPFTLPTAQFRFVGTWAPSTAYYVNDVFEVSGTGLFVVLKNHTSASTFNPAATSGGDAVYRQMLRSNNPIPIVTVTATSFTPNPEDGNQYFRCTNVSGCTIHLQSDFQPNDELTFRQCTSGALSFVSGDTGGTINPATGLDTSTNRQGAVVTAKFVADGSWDLFGDLAAST